MQNGKAALSLIEYNKKNKPTQKNILELLSSMFQHDGKDSKFTKLSFSTFFAVKA